MNIFFLLLASFQPQITEKELISLGWVGGGGERHEFLKGKEVKITARLEIFGGRGRMTVLAPSLPCKALGFTLNAFPIYGKRARKWMWMTTAVLHQIKNFIIGRRKTPNILSSLARMLAPAKGRETKRAQFLTRRFSGSSITAREPAVACWAALSFALPIFLSAGHGRRSRSVSRLIYGLAGAHKGFRRKSELSCRRAFKADGAELPRRWGHGIRSVVQCLLSFFSKRRWRKKWTQNQCVDIFASVIQRFSFREDAAQRCCGVASAAHLHSSPVLVLLHLLCSRWVFLHQLHMAESTPVLHLSEAKVAVTQVKRVRAELKVLDVKTLVHVREEFPQSCVDLWYWSW